MADATARIAARLAAIADAGIDISTIIFDASHGRHTMEYYDGLTFSFHADQPGWPPVASGGRYDALTAVLGQGAGNGSGSGAIPAVGGIIRPALVAALC